MLPASKLFLTVHLAHIFIGLPSSLGDDLPPLDTSAESIGIASSDWGYTVSVTPQGVYHPNSASDLANLLSIADDHKIEVAARGRGHNVLGTAQVENGIVVDMSSLNEIGEIETDGEKSSIWVGAGATWRDVAAQTLPLGQLPPVFNDYIDLTVGGTLSLGGVGSQTVFKGMQVDNVLELEIATIKDGVLSCSPSDGVCPFDAILGGLGQFGIITKVRLPLEPAPSTVNYIRALYSSLGDMLQEMDNLIAAAGVLGVQGFAAPSDPQGLAVATGNAFPDAVLPSDVGPFVFYLETYYDSSLGDGPVSGLAPVEGGLNSLLGIPTMVYLARLDPVEAALRADGLWFFPHPWIDVFLPASQAETFITNELSSLGPLDAVGPILIYPYRTGTMSQPKILFFLR